MMMSRIYRQFSSRLFTPSVSKKRDSSKSVYQQVQDILKQGSEHPTPCSSPRLSFEKSEDEICSISGDTYEDSKKNPLIETLNHLIYRNHQNRKKDDLDLALITTETRLKNTKNPTTRQRLKDRIQELSKLKSELACQSSSTVVGFIGWTDQRPNKTTQYHRFSQYDAVLLKIADKYTLRILKSSGLIHGNYSQTQDHLKKLIPTKDKDFEFYVRKQPKQSSLNLDEQSLPVESTPSNYLNTLKTTLDRVYDSQENYFLSDLFELKKRLLEQLDNGNDELNTVQKATLLFLDIWLWRHSDTAFDDDDFKDVLKDKKNQQDFRRTFREGISIAAKDISAECETETTKPDEKVKFLNSLISDNRVQSV